MTAADFTRYSSALCCMVVLQFFAAYDIG